MKHPTKKQVQYVINRLTEINKKVLGLGNKNVAVCMEEIKINSCGTPMCHAGYYLLAKKNFLKNRNTSESTKSILDSNYYSNGAFLMAKDLGFNYVFDLKSWAIDYPYIWGNVHGNQMFGSGYAFNNFDNTLQSIINHWKGVKERLPK